MIQYSKEVLDHFYNPRNVGEMKDPDGVGEVGNMKCGDVMYVYIRVAKRPSSKAVKQVGRKAEQEEYIEDAKFRTLGCAAAIATSSIMTELAIGKSLDDAYNISRDDINKSLGILPKQKYHCSILSADGLHRAIDDYRKKSS